MDNCKDLFNKIKQAETIILIPHVNPDGDTLGALSALYKIISNMGKSPVALIHNEVPTIYKFLPFMDRFVNIDEIENTEFDLAISLDVAAKDRMIHAQKIFDKAKCKVNIDHHHTNINFGDLNYVNGSASSTGEVLFEIIKNCSLNIDKDTANLLYVAIMTDTGGFRFENTSSKVLKMASELVEYGADACELYRKIYEAKPKSQVILNGIAISNAVFLNDNKIAYTLISDKDMKKANAKPEDTDGIAETLRSIGDVEVSFVLKQTENGFTKVSMRSKHIDVSKIAAKFDGGGHFYAAGCTINKPIKIALDKILEEIKL